MPLKKWYDNKFGIDVCNMWCKESGQNSTLKDIVVTLKMLKNVVDELSFISQCNFVVSVIVWLKT